MTKSKALLCICLSFIGGIFFDSFISIFQLPLLLISGFFLIIPFRKNKEFIIIALCVLSFIFAAWLHQKAVFTAENNLLKEYIGKKDISIIGIVDNLPITREKTRKLKIRVLQIGKKEFSTKKERVLVTYWKYPEYEYGDRLKITGELKEPKVFNDFNYKEYLAKDKIYAVMDIPKIELLSKNSGNQFLKTLFFLKNTLKKSINKILPMPQAGLLEALIFGDEENISKEWKEKFNLTGTRHIAAVSGMNITIISVLILNFFLFLGFWRNQAFYLSVIFILLYVLIIGAPASGVRAGIMGILLLTAQYFGRISNGFRAVIFSAVLMLWFNPLLLKSDIGFQLSFLAVLGLVYLQPIFLNLFKKLPKTLEIRYSLSSTLAAQFFTLPVLIYNFGQIPLVGPFVNLFIIPFLSLITILGFILALLGVFFLPIGKLMSFLVYPILTYILKIIDFSSKLSFIAWRFENISFIWVFILYIFLGLVTYWLQEKQRLRFLQY